LDAIRYVKEKWLRGMCPGAALSTLWGEDISLRLVLFHRVRSGCPRNQSVHCHGTHR
jgi:hypothetical protein